MTTLLEARGLAIGYRLARGREQRLLSGTDLVVAVGDLVCLLGPNGSGKSTLLRTLAGMQRPLEGELRLEGEDLLELDALRRARRVSVVLTEGVDAGALSARELVGLGRYPYTGWHGRLQSSDEAQVQRAIELVGAEPLAERSVVTLSDGERQRVLIARALAQEPRLMILDEPTAFLDLPRRIQTLKLLADLTRETGVAVILATHHLDLALDHADAVWLLADGRLESGSPEDVALSGALERTFLAEDLAYDEKTGTFRRLAGSGPPPLPVSGAELPRLWTERALQRAEQRIAGARKAGLEVRIVEAGGRCEWLVEGEDLQFRCRSIRELVGRLQAVP